MVSLARGHLLRAEDVAEIGQGGIRGQRGAEGALPRIDEVTCGHGAAIVEDGIRTQVEGVDRAIGAHVPGLSQVGRQVEARIEGDQSAVEALVARAVCGGGIIFTRIGRLAAFEYQRLVHRDVDPGSGARRA